MRSRQGATLVELSCCVVMLSVGAAWGVTGARGYGWVGAVVGFLLGCVCVPVVLMVIGYLLDAGQRLPPCRMGRCRREIWGGGGYEAIGPHQISGTVFRCRCGGEYVMTDGRRFMERLPDGTLKPYRRRSLFRGWLPDDGSEGQDSPGDSRGGDPD